MIRLGVIGTGGMAGGHARLLGQIKGVALTACCDVDRDRAEAFARQHNIPAVYTDYETMLAEAPLDAITNVTPDKFHAAISIAALKRRLHVLCEKPMAATLAEAQAMLVAAKRAGTIHMVNYSKRNFAGLQGAAKVIAAGKIGRVIHVEASYLQCWLSSTVWGDWRTQARLTWRLSTRHGSQGTLGDLGCHVYDMVSLLAGPFAEIQCRLACFDKGVKGNRLGEYVLDANDSFVTSVVFRNGAIGTIHSSRWATGHPNREYVCVFGDKAAVRFDAERDPNAYEICTARDAKDRKWVKVACKPVPTNYQRFIRAIRTGRQDPSDFANGLLMQRYLHYSVVSDRKGGFVKVT